MAKILHCRDLGFDCDRIIREETEQEVLLQAAEHARDVHGLEVIGHEVAQQVLGAIRDG